MDTEASELGEELDQRSAPATDQQLNRSTFSMSVLIVISRITGFLRTWAQAHALGVTLMASCYTVANNLPNQLYEIVMGGMLVTAFLPVYLSERKRGGTKVSNTYASNLTTLVCLSMGILSVACIIFAAPLVYTQSFSAGSDFDSELASYFFRFFAIEILLYSLSSVLSGMLNAEREYVWSTVGPVINNVVVTASFIAYSVLGNSAPGLALILLALGNPLGVLAQVVVQIPALYRRGIRLRPHLDIHDKALRDTFSIGIPSLVIMLVSFVTVSVSTSASLAITPVGASVGYYARLWYTLPYSIFAVPVTTALFTELALSYASQDNEGFRRSVESGTRRLIIFCVPFALFLITFSVPLVTVLAAGSFSVDSIQMISSYLNALAVSLPAYAFCMFLQKVFSSMRRLGTFAVISVVAGVVQCGLCMFAGDHGMLDLVALSSLAFFGLVDILSLIILWRETGAIKWVPLMGTLFKSCVFGGLGSLAGLLAMRLLDMVLGPAGTSTSRSVLWCAVGGVLALVVCYGPQMLLGGSDAGSFEVVRKLFKKKTA